MKIFLSWSGESSRRVARALHEWLPFVLRYAEPWFSDVDIAAGARWSTELATQLEGTRFGVICLTQENLSAPWILFEAGALSKAVLRSSVFPYLLDVHSSELSGPLAQFQSKRAEKTATFELVSSINKHADTPESTERLREFFEVFWPKLESELSAIALLPDGPTREQERLEEPAPDVLSLLRTLDARMVRIEAAMAHPSGSSRVPVPAPAENASPDSVVSPAAQEEARRLARLLISEIKLYNEGTVEEGRRSHDLYRRLQGEIKDARARYEQVIYNAVRTRMNFFQDELIEILAEGDELALGPQEESAEPAP
jgi:molybdopterin converting factor small subunit